VKRNKKRLDQSLRVDRGLSGFDGTNRDIGALGEFLGMVENGRVKPGSYLVVESLDRLTREEVMEALWLIIGLIRQGVRVVQLRPQEVVYQQGCDSHTLMMMIMELQRGHGESLRKSGMVGSAWAEKRRRARAREARKETARMGSGSMVMTRIMPAWCRLERGRAVLIPERAKALKRIFALLAAGYGYARVLRKLNEEGVPPFGDGAVRPGCRRGRHSGRWTLAYIAKIANDRRAVGEHQPTCGGKPDGPPIAGYFPAAVGEKEFAAAQAVIAPRRRHGPAGRKVHRIGKYIHLFPGLLRDARTGGTYTASSKKRARILIASAWKEGPGGVRSFPLEVFERAVMKELREVDAHQVLNGDHPDDSQALAGELTAVEERIAAIKAQLVDDRDADVPFLSEAGRELTAKRKRLAAELADARQRAAHPLSETWGDAQGLLDAYDAAADKDDARLRLRAAFRRMIDAIWVLVVPRGTYRLAAVQVRFAGGEEHRDYLITYRGGCHHREACWWPPVSLADAAALGPPDLRERADARALERLLEKIDVEALTASATPPI
jgi:DNA invertase Pin-like site-specific DNA recombinase